MADLIFAALDAPIARPSGGHVSSQFKSSWDATLALLDAELDRVRAKEPTLYVDVAPSRITRAGRIDGGISAVRTPGVRLDFMKPTRRGGRTEDVPASFPCATYWKVQDNVRGIALTLEALRAVDRYGATTEAGEQYVGFLRLPGPGGVNTTAVQLSPERAARILVDAHPDFRGASPYTREAMARALLDGLADESMQFARVARNAAHPDAGGSTAAFTTLSAALDVLAQHRRS